MAHIAGGYASRVLSRRPSNEYQEGPEEESWCREFNVPFTSKRPGGQSFDYQGYPVKRARHGTEAPHPSTRPQQTYPGMNGTIKAQSSLHLPALASLPRQQAQLGPATQHLNMVQSMQVYSQNHPPFAFANSSRSHCQTGSRQHSIESQSRILPISQPASQMQGNHVSSRHITLQRNQTLLSQPATYAEPNAQLPEARKSLANPFHPGQNSSQRFQTQNPRGSRATCVVPQRHTGIHNNMEKFTTPRYQSVPPLSPAQQLPAQYIAPGAGASGYTSQPSPQRLQSSMQGFQPTQGLQNSRGLQPAQGFQISRQSIQSSTMQPGPNSKLQRSVQPRSEPNLTAGGSIQKLPVMKQNGPFIIDEEEDEVAYSESLNINTETRSNEVTASQIQVPIINFALGRRGARPLTYGLDDPPDQKNDAESGVRKNKPGFKWSKKAEDAEREKIQKEAQAYAKIKEKEDMAAKANDTNALFEQPINEAAQARIKTSIQKEETRKLEIEVRRKHRQAMTEDLEWLKKETAGAEKAQREAERASRKAKTQEEREEIQKIREAEDKKRLEEQKSKAEAINLKKMEEKNEREAAAREKEAGAETKRQQDAENLKKSLEASRLTAISLKPARKGQCGREENSGRATTPHIETPEPPVDDGGLFVPEQVVDEASNEVESSDTSVAVRLRRDIQRPPLTPPSPSKSISKTTPTLNTEQKASYIAATIKQIPGSEDLSLRALAGWRGARKANTETKVASIVIEHYKEKLLADQKMRDEALTQERMREKAEYKEDIAALFEKLTSNLREQVQGELKGAIDKVLNVRLPVMPTNMRTGLNPARSIAVSPKGYASETQCFLGSNKSRGLAPLGEQSQSDSDARKREKEDEKARKRFEAKLSKDCVEKGRYMSEYEISSIIDRQKEYREKRNKRLEKEKRMAPYGGGIRQSQARFGYEDIDIDETNPERPNKSNSQSDKGRCGGVMAKLRESNGSLGSFKEAATAKIVSGRIDLGYGTDSESDVSEEDPDENEPGTTTRDRPKVFTPSNIQDLASNITSTEADGIVATVDNFGIDRTARQVVKPRHLQDKEMAYVFSVQRSEISSQEKSLPITIKQFFDRDDANDFAEEELRKRRWGPSVPRPQITQSYSKDTGLFSGRAVIDYEDNMVECVDVVAQAQYIGDLDNFERERIKAIFKPKAYFIFKSITKKVQAPLDPFDDDSSEIEETEQNMEMGRNNEEEQFMGADQNAETEQNTEVDRSKEPKNMDIDQNDNEKSDDHKYERSRESVGDAIDALFEEESEVELSDNSEHNLNADVHQLSLASAASSETKPDMILTQTTTPLESYTDRELANKRASEIFLAEIRPVGGDISQLAAFQKDAVEPIRECVESHNKSGELFSASNDYGNNGEEIRIWVEDFKMMGPLN